MKKDELMQKINSVIEDALIAQVKIGNTLRIAIAAGVTEPARKFGISSAHATFLVGLSERTEALLATGITERSALNKLICEGWFKTAAEHIFESMGA